MNGFEDNGDRVCTGCWQKFKAVDGHTCPVKVDEALALKQDKEAEAHERAAELQRQDELDREALATETEDADELAEAEPASRLAFDGNRYLGLRSPHES